MPFQCDFAAPDFSPGCQEETRLGDGVALDTAPAPAHDRGMWSPRVRKLLAEAIELPAEERAKLVAELARTLPEGLRDEDDFSEQWSAEIARRLDDEGDRGEALTSEALRERIDVMASRDE